MSNGMEILAPGAVAQGEVAVPETVLAKLQRIVGSLLSNFHPQVEAARGKSLVLKEKALAIVINDEATAEQASTALDEVIKFQKEAVKFIEPLKGPTTEALTYLRATEREITADAAAGEQNLRNKLRDWELLRARIQREAERLQQKRAQEQADNAALEVAEAAQKAAAPPEVVDALLSAPPAVASIPVMPVMAKPTGVNLRTYWHAEIGGCTKETTDNEFRLNLVAQAQFLLLVKAVAEGKAPLACLSPNWSVLNKYADASKTTLALPGVEAKSTASITKTGRR